MREIRVGDSVISTSIVWRCPKESWVDQYRSTQPRPSPNPLCPVHLCLPVEHRTNRQDVRTRGVGGVGNDFRSLPGGSPGTEREEGRSEVPMSCLRRLRSRESSSILKPPRRTLTLRSSVTPETTEGRTKINRCVEGGGVGIGLRRGT